jgi:hypothetical protein
MLLCFSLHAEDAICGILDVNDCKVGSGLSPMTLEQSSLLNHPVSANSLAKHPRPAKYVLSSLHQYVSPQHLIILWQSHCRIPAQF